MTTELQHVMVDIETLGNGPNGMIVQVGACRFDPQAGEAGMISTPEGCFSATVKPTGNVQIDGVMEFDTVRWWLKQEPVAQQRVFWPAAEPQYGIDVIVHSFVSWLKSQGEFRYIWANPPDFDLRLLREAWERTTPKVHRLGDREAQPVHEWPIRYKQPRDFRTLRTIGNLMGIEPPVRVGVHHDALDDALHQAGYAIKVLRHCAASALTRRNSCRLPLRRPMDEGGKILKGPRPLISKAEVKPAASGEPGKVDITFKIAMGPQDKRPKCRLCADVAMRGDLCLKCYKHEMELS